MLYPLKFKPILKERIWGGERLKKLYRQADNAKKGAIGESWVLSGVQGNISIVTNGFLKGNTIEELVEVYMGDLLGDSLYDRFGVEFPLLIKLIDTQEFLSVQVHPDDAMAKERHHAYGKSEFWYFIESQDESQIITGFNKPFTRDDYFASVKDGSFKENLKYETVLPHNYLFIPAGSLHSLGKGIFLVEIQQTSDITYRVYDWDRVDAQGKSRELHVDFAADAIDFTADPLAVETVPFVENAPQELLVNPLFQVNRLSINGIIERELVDYDSFRLYICLGGRVELFTPENEAVVVDAGEVVLVPASLLSVTLESTDKALLLEVFVP